MLNSLNTGVTRRERRRHRYHQLMIAREKRKNSRQIYWKPLIAIETATILAIAWFIQMEIIRNRLVPSYMTYSQMKKFPLQQGEVLTQAVGVFGRMYRDLEYSKFVLTDTGKCHLDGRIGYIDWYDTARIGYRALICPLGSSDPREGIHMVVKPEHMECTKKVDLTKTAVYTKIKEKQCQITIRNRLPKNESDTFPITIRSNVLQKLLGIYPNPEMQSREAFLKLVELQEEEEKINAEEKRKIIEEQSNYAKNMSSFFSSHAPITIRPRKRIKYVTDPTKPLSPQEHQIQAVWNSKREHIRNVIFTPKGDDEKHLFTFPFGTSDNSLMQCSKEMIELDGHHSKGIRHDDVFKHFQHTPIVLTTTSLKSLQPGSDIDADVLDFCANW